MNISYEDFSKIDMRVGTIKSAQPFEKARNPAYILMIDFWPEGIKKSSAQITTLYTCEELVGKQVVAVINFPEKQIANIQSECLVLGAISENNDITLLW